MDGIPISILREDIQIMNTAVTGTSLVRLEECRQLHLLLNSGYSHEILCVKRDDSK